MHSRNQQSHIPSSGQPVRVYGTRSSSRHPAPSTLVAPTLRSAKRRRRTIWDLPQEILIHIMMFSEPTTVLALRRTCRVFRRLTYDTVLWVSVLRYMYVQRSAPPPPKDVLARLGYQQIEALTKRCRQFEDTMKVAGTRHQGRRIQPIHCSLSHCRPAPEIWTLVPGGKFLFQVLRMPKETPGLEILVQDIDVHGAPRRLFCCQINPGEVGHYAVHPLSQTVRDEVRVFLFLVVAVRPFSTKTWMLQTYAINLPQWQPTIPLTHRQLSTYANPTLHCQMISSVSCGQFYPLQVGMMPGSSTTFAFASIPQRPGIYLFVHDWMTQHGWWTPTNISLGPNEWLTLGFSGPDILATNACDPTVTTAIRIFPSEKPSSGQISNTAWRFRELKLPFTPNTESCTGPDMWTACANPSLAFQAYDLQDRELHQIWYDYRTRLFDVLSIPVPKHMRHATYLSSCHVGETHSTTISYGVGKNSGSIFCTRVPNPPHIRRATSTPDGQSRPPPPTKNAWREILSESILPGAEQGVMLPVDASQPGHILSSFDEVSGRLALGMYWSEALPRILLVDFCW